MEENTSIKFIITILLGICCIYDMKQKEVPMVPIIAAGIGGLSYVFTRDEKLLYLGGALIGVICLLFAKLTKESLGYGDGYLLLVIGLWIGVKHNLILLIGSLFLSAIFSILILVIKKGNRKTTIPFVPFLVLIWTYRLFV